MAVTYNVRDKMYKVITFTPKEPKQYSLKMNHSRILNNNNNNNNNAKSSGFNFYDESTTFI